MLFIFWSLTPFAWLVRVLFGWKEFSQFQQANERNWGKCWHQQGQTKWAERSHEHIANQQKLDNLRKEIFYLRENSCRWILLLLQNYLSLLGFVCCNLLVPTFVVQEQNRKMLLLLFSNLMDANEDIGSQVQWFVNLFQTIGYFSHIFHLVFIIIFLCWIFFFFT